MACRCLDECYRRSEAGVDAWWSCYREQNGQYQPEPYWLYFELAQAHNALLMGQRDRVWTALDYGLAHHDLSGLYGSRERGVGVDTEYAVYGVTLINQLRGCHRFDSITSHGWSQAELWLFQRAILVGEWDDGLLFFAGVPAAWLYSQAVIEFRELFTNLDPVSARLEIAADGKSASISLASPEGPSTLRLPNINECTLLPNSTTQEELP